MDARDAAPTVGSLDQEAQSRDGQLPRLKVVCVIRHGGDYLFAVGTDPIGPQTFLIPVGGGIDFGELAAAAAAREVQEEIGVEIKNPRLLGVLENIFTYNGELGHEVVFCFIDQIPSRDMVPSEGLESNGESFPLRWLSRDELRSCPIPVYPDGILGLILDEPPSDAQRNAG